MARGRLGLTLNTRLDPLIPVVVSAAPSPLDDPVRVFRRGG